jgi:RNA polymerase sigma-70 factor (ECF subfamily)
MIVVYPRGAMAEPLAREEPLIFAAVYDEAFPWVYRAARRLGVHPSSLDDVVQDVFLVVHRKLPTFERRSSLRSWIYGITLHVVRGRRRTAKRRPETPTLDEELAALPGKGDPQHDAMRREALADVLRILDSMSDEQREVFVLAELEELSAPEIAEASGINLNTVYSRLRAARKTFDEGAARLRARDRHIPTAVPVAAATGRTR